MPRVVVSLWDDSSPTFVFRFTRWALPRLGVFGAHQVVFGALFGSHAFLVTTKRHL